MPDKHSYFQDIIYDEASRFGFTPAKIFESNVYSFVHPLIQAKALLFHLTSGHQERIKNRRDVHEFHFLCFLNAQRAGIL